ncbi:hypothetical protein F5Y17DRAFT_475153 [Xylariaceae sp. FL0594]|nr:hypothetical protein F5Y17DRAFT_475153 [Xylariaceae sp. FL0594]
MDITTFVGPVPQEAVDCGLGPSSEWLNPEDGKVYRQPHQWGTFLHNLQEFRDAVEYACVMGFADEEFEKHFIVKIGAVKAGDKDQLGVFLLFPPVGVDADEIDGLAQAWKTLDTGRWPTWVYPGTGHDHQSSSASIALAPTTPLSRSGRKELSFDTKVWVSRYMVNIVLRFYHRRYFPRAIWFVEARLTADRGRCEYSLLLPWTASYYHQNSARETGKILRDLYYASECDLEITSKDLFGSDTEEEEGENKRDGEEHADEEEELVWF